MIANDVTFGVEIETLATQTGINAGLVIGPYHHGVQVPYLPAGWRAERDGSLRPDTRPGVPCEIVSPKLKGIDGLLQIIAVCKKLQEMGHYVNATCGLHVHVSWESGDAVALARLITLVARFQDGLYACTGTKSREDGIYCKGHKNYNDPDRAKRELEYDRFHMLNLVPLATGLRRAVEFRCFSGSLNAVKICAWVQIAIGLVIKAQISNRKKLAWALNHKESRKRGRGNGQYIFDQLMHFLGWFPTYQEMTGIIKQGETALAVIPDVKMMKKTLGKLARKYDGNPPEIE